MEYTTKAEDGECIFCRKAIPGSDEDNFVVVRRNSAFLMMNLYPYTTGHLMLAPFRHVAAISDLTEEEACETMSLLAFSERLLKESMSPQGFNVGLNVGKCAGAGCPSHIHLHIVPRWEGDTNFMPVVSETKVLPETLKDTYARLLAARRKLEGK